MLVYQRLKCEASVLLAVNTIYHGSFSVELFEYRLDVNRHFRDFERWLKIWRIELNRIKNFPRPLDIIRQPLCITA